MGPVRELDMCCLQLAGTGNQGRMKKERLGQLLWQWSRGKMLPWEGSALPDCVRVKASHGGVFCLFVCFLILFNSHPKGTKASAEEKLEEDY